MTGNVLLMNPWQAEIFQREYQRVVWAKMMKGDVTAWKAFFEFIEDGTSRAFLADHARYPI